MKNSLIPRFLTLFYFIALTGCTTDDQADNKSGCYEKCWAIIDSNTSEPIPTAWLSMTYEGRLGSVSSKYMNADENGNACSCFHSFSHIRFATADAPGYDFKHFREPDVLPDKIYLTP